MTIKNKIQKTFYLINGVIIHGNEADIKMEKLLAMKN